MISRGNTTWLCPLAGATLSAAMLLAPGMAGAASVTQCGPNICYTYDNSQAAALPTAFGLPTLVGDAMVFLPPSFIAHSTGGAGFVTSTANFIFSRVYTTNPLNEIASMNVHEEYDYEIITDGQVRVTLYNQARSNTLPTDGDSTTVNFQSTGDSAGNQIGTLDSLLNPAADFTGLANDMAVTIQNTLRAYTSAAGQDAFIEKKFTLFVQTTNPVPVPGALWLLGSSLGLLGWLRRKTR